MTTRKKSQQTAPAVSTSPYWMWGGLILGVVLHVVHLPGGLVTWLALVIATFNAYPPEVTGKGEMGEPVAANPYEERLQRTYRAWKGLRGPLFGMTKSVIPWWPLPTTWIVAVCLGASMLFLPRFMVVPDQVVWAEAVAVFLMVLALGEMSTSRNSDQSDPMPQVSVGDVVSAVAKGPWGKRALMVVSAAAGALIAVAAQRVLVEVFPVVMVVPELGPMPSSPIVPEAPVAALWGVAAAVSAVSAVVRGGVVATWRARVAAREAWKQRFKAKLPKLPAPDLMDHRELTGGITVDTFSVPGTQQREKYMQSVKELAGSVGDGAGLYSLTFLVDDGAGGRIESNSMFRYVVVPKDAYPDLSNGATEDEIAGLLVECLVSQQMEWAGPALSEVTRLTLPESPAPVWLFEFDASRTSVDPLRMSIRSLNGMFGTRVLIDKAMMSIGAMLEDGTVWDEQACGQPGEAMRSMYQDVADEDWWEKVWQDVEGSPEKTPTYYPQMTQTATLPDGGEIRYSAFLTRLALHPEMYYGKEAKLATAIQNPAFTAIMPFPDASASTRSRTARHVQAIAVAWAPAARSDGQPNRIPRLPQDVKPDRSSGRPRPRSAQELVLSGMVSRAFTAAKLGQPLVTQVKPLSDATARQHIWQVDIQLQSNTYAEVLKKSPNIRQDLGAPWLQMEPTAEGASLFMGVQPTQRVVTNPRNWRKAIDLEWSGTWVLANVTGSDGATPTLVDAHELEGNPDVMRAEFELPQTLTLERIKGSKAKLKSARGLQFLEIATGEGPTRMDMLFSHKDPVPFPAPVDFPAMTASEGYAFGVGFDGLPRAFVPKRDVHMIMVGMSGTGKSVTIQMVVAAALAKGSWVAVIDPSKGGTDFAFADDWLIAPRAKEPDEAAATLEALYQEVQDRKALHQEYRVGSWKDLPKDVRRPEVLVIIDEFTSLVMSEKLPPKSSDPSAQRERSKMEQRNAKRAKIGNLIGKIFREARSVGFAVMLGTQKLDSKTLSMVPGGNDLKTNASRIILGNPALGELASALRDPYHVPDMGDYVPQGRGRFESAVSGAEPFQTWWAEQPELRDFLAGEGAPVPERTLDVASFMPPPVEEVETEVDGESGLLVLKSAPLEEDVEEFEMDMGDLSLDDLVLDADDDESDEDGADGEDGGDAEESGPDTVAVESFDEPSLPAAGDDDAGEDDQSQVDTPGDLDFSSIELTAGDETVEEILDLSEPVREEQPAGFASFGQAAPAVVDPGEFEVVEESPASVEDTAGPPFVEEGESAPAEPSPGPTNGGPHIHTPKGETAGFESFTPPQNTGHGDDTPDENPGDHAAVFEAFTLKAPKPPKGADPESGPFAKF